MTHTVMPHDNDNGEQNEPLGNAPVIETEPGKGLFETWHAALSWHDPSLAEDALHVISESFSGPIPPPV